MKKSTVIICFILSTVMHAFAQITVSTTVTNATVCTAPCNGTATATAAGGTPPYVYGWTTNPPQTTQTATGLCAGTYSVIVFDITFSQGAGSATVTCTSSGVEEYELNSFLSVFPNPASQNVSVVTSFPDGGEITSLSVFNILGETAVYREYSAVNKFDNSLYVGDLPNGIYFLKVKTKAGTAIQKFIVSKE